MFKTTSARGLCAKMPAKGQINLALGTSKYHQNRFHRTPKYHPQGTSKPHYRDPEVPPQRTPKYHRHSDAGVSKYHRRSIFRGPEVPPWGFEVPIVRFRLRSAEFLCRAGVWGSRSTTMQATTGTPKYHREGPEVPLYAVAIYGDRSKLRRLRRPFLRMMRTRKAPPPIRRGVASGSRALPGLFPEVRRRRILILRSLFGTRCLKCPTSLSASMDQACVLSGTFVLVCVGRRFAFSAKPPVTLGYT